MSAGGAWIGESVACCGVSANICVVDGFGSNFSNFMVLPYETFDNQAVLNMLKI